MAYDVTYSFDTLADNSSDFSFIGPDYSVLSAENTDGAWCWTSTGSTSSSTGPPSGTACVYTETSSPVTVDEVFTMTLASANEVDASAYSLYVEFDICVQGNTDGTLVFEAFDGTDWNEVASFSGDSVTTMTSKGPYNLTAYDNTDFSIRFVVTVGDASATYHNDFAVDEINIYGEDKVTDPEITNCDDEDFYPSETSVTITGTTFETEGANSRVRIDSSSAGTGTSQTQTDTSWADTSIDFTVSLGSLSYGTNYLFVRNQSLDENETGYAINLFLYTDTDGINDSTIYDGQTGVVLSGEGFNATQGNSKVYLCDSSDGSGTNVEQTVTSWGASSVTFTVDIGTLSLGTAYVILARNQSSLGDSSERLTNAQTATLGAVPTNPEIDSVSGDDLFNEVETDVSIVGNAFLSSQGTGKVEIGSSATYDGSVEEQDISTWSDTEIEFDPVIGSLDYGTNYMFVTNDDGDRNSTGFSVYINEAPITDGLYKTSNIQTTITSSGLTMTSFLIGDE